MTLLDTFQITTIHTPHNVPRDSVINCRLQQSVLNLPLDLSLADVGLKILILCGHGTPCTPFILPFTRSHPSHLISFHLHTSGSAVLNPNLLFFLSEDFVHRTFFVGGRGLCELNNAISPCSDTQELP